MAAERQTDPTLITLIGVRLSFPHLFKMQAFEDGEPRYSCNFLIDPSTKQGKKNIALIEEAMDIAFDKGMEKSPKLKKMGSWEKCSDDKLCLRDGSLKDYDGYDGMMYLRATNDRRPVTVDRKHNPVTESDDVFYAGCVVNAKVSFYAYDRKSQGVSSSLKLVQFWEDGEEFGGSGPVSADDLPGGEDDDEAPRSRRSSRDEPPARSRRSRDDDEDDEPPARKRRAVEEDDEPPARKRRATEDEDDAPKARKRRADEDEDEEPPARKRRAVEEDDEPPARRRRSSVV